MAILEVKCLSCLNLRDNHQKCKYEHPFDECLNIKITSCDPIYNKSARWNDLKKKLPHHSATALYALWEPDWLDESWLEDKLFEI